MKIKLQGGYRDGLEMEIGSSAHIIEVPRIDPAFDYVRPITPDAVKHHSWDDDALTISYDRYRLTDMAVDGCIIYSLM